MAETAIAPLCLITEDAMITCDAVHVIECGHDDDGIEGVVVIPGAVVLGCTRRPGHLGGLHHDIDGLWWRADG